MRPNDGTEPMRMASSFRDEPLTFEVCTGMGVMGRAHKKTGLSARLLFFLFLSLHSAIFRCRSPAAHSVTGRASALSHTHLQLHSTPPHSTSIHSATMGLLHKDLEKGNAKEEARRSATLADDNAPTDEYTGLVRFISTYHDTHVHAAAADEEDKCLPAKRHWWSGKAKDSGAGFDTPPEWLETDMKTGLTSADVEQRRKKAGWNELMTEKENPFLKFLGYFRGPILYGDFPISVADHVMELKLTSYQSWSSRSSLPLVSAIGLTSA